eukprot:5017-Heterococcus_DN1.PRE.2
MAVHAYNNRYTAELGEHTLLHFLALVALLDKAKERGIVPGAPCLFRLDASVKSSEAVLKTFCQFLKGEGDIVRHLAKIGYVVTHTQCYIDEFDFSVNNIAVDLRDGVRLCRLVELLCGTVTAKRTLSGKSPVGTLTSQLRVPANDRLQKIHNTGIALAKLRADGAIPAHTSSNGVTAKDIVDGHQCSPNSAQATAALCYIALAHHQGAAS